MASGIGPKSSSLLDKLGLKSITAMSDAELRELVSADRVKRTMTRVAGRINRIAKDKTQVAYKPKVAPTLESIGLAPSLISKLRLSGKSDEELITQLKAKGII
jgi:hypothetical protein